MHRATTSPLIPARQRLLAPAGALAALLLPGSPVVHARSEAPLRVVASFSILGDWVARVGGDRIDLTTIVPAGGDAHTFDPNPDQVARIADADLIFEIGLGFERWMDDMVDASGAAATRIAVSDGLALLTAGGDENGQDAHEDEDEHDHGDHDPHIWGDVANAIHAAGVIRDALAATDPANAAAHEADAAAYISELEALDSRIRDQVTTLPEERRKLVTTHDTFGYYAHAYGFEIVGTALNSLSTEGGDPPASEIAALVAAIQDAGVPAIFAETVSSSDLMEVIAAEAGVTLAPPLYSDALGDAESDAPTYVALMDYNTTTIVTALGGG